MKKGELNSVIKLIIMSIVIILIISIGLAFFTGVIPTPFAQAPPTGGVPQPPALPE